MSLKEKVKESRIGNYYFEEDVDFAIKELKEIGRYVKVGDLYILTDKDFKEVFGE